MYGHQAVQDAENWELRFSATRRGGWLTAGVDGRSREGLHRVHNETGGPERGDAPVAAAIETLVKQRCQSRCGQQNDTGCDQTRRDL